MKWYLYILECSNKTLYTGVTTNLKRRFKEHQTKKGGHYTSYNKGINILYTETYSSRSEAQKRESQIKGWTRRKKLALIKGDKAILKAAARRRNR